MPVSIVVVAKEHCCTTLYRTDDNDANRIVTSLEQIVTERRRRTSRPLRGRNRSEAVDIFGYGNESWYLIW
jgi:hypothetical protein